MSLFNSHVHSLYSCQSAFCGILEVSRAECVEEPACRHLPLYLLIIRNERNDADADIRMKVLAGYERDHWAFKLL